MAQAFPRSPVRQYGEVHHGDVNTMHDDELGDDAEDTAALTEDQLIARIDAEKRVARLLEAQGAALRSLSDREREVLRKRFEKNPTGAR